MWRSLCLNISRPGVAFVPAAGTIGLRIELHAVLYIIHLAGKVSAYGPYSLEIAHRKSGAIKRSYCGTDDSPPAARLAGRAVRGLFEIAANLEDLPRMGAAIEAYERDGPGFGLTQDGHAGSCHSRV